MESTPTSVRTVISLVSVISFGERQRFLGQTLMVLVYAKCEVAVDRLYDARRLERSQDSGSVSRAPPSEGGRLAER